MSKKKVTDEEVALGKIDGYKVVVTNTEKHSDLANNQTVLKVDYSIMDAEDELVEEKSEAFPLDTSTETIKETLARALALCVEEAKGAIINAEANAANANADATIEALKGLEVAQVEK